MAVNWEANTTFSEGSTAFLTGLRNLKISVISKRLILDDFVDLLETMKYVLERKGYAIQTSVTSGIIHQDIDEFQPDLLIPDISVAGNDGKEICNRLKTNAGTERFSGIGLFCFPQKPYRL